jgi:large subunit ribosomal protein L25
MPDIGGLGEAPAVPPGYAARPEAASSVASVSMDTNAPCVPCLGTTVAPWRRATLHQALPLHSRAVAGERVKLEVAERESRGSADTRRLRKQGLIPGVLYGRGKEPHAFCVPERELRRVLTGPSGLHAILDVVLEGQTTTHASILKDYQQDVITGRIAHIDLHEVRLDQPIHAQVVIELVGESAGTKEGGVLSQVSREINVEALPMEIPERIEVDISEMQLGDTLRLADVAKQEGVIFLDDPEETVLATVTVPTEIVEPEPEEEELEEGAELAEGEEPPEGVAEGEGEAEPDADAGSGESGEPGTTEG